MTMQIIKKILIALSISSLLVFILTSLGINKIQKQYSLCGDINRMTALNRDFFQDRNNYDETRIQEHLVQTKDFFNDVFLSLEIEKNFKALQSSSNDIDYKHNLDLITYKIMYYLSGQSSILTEWHAFFYSIKTWSKVILAISIFCSIIFFLVNKNLKRK